MGGELCVESEVGRGSPMRHIIGYRGRRRSVLVVDDISSNRAVLIDMLQPLGFTVLEAEDGRLALEVAQQSRPDLILMDRLMPVLSGPEAVQHICSPARAAGPAMGLICAQTGAFSGSL
jgi:CheY-like chemotaxis protein